MNSRLFLSLLFITCLTGRAFADDDAKAAADKAAADKAALEERIKARLADHVAKKDAPVLPVAAAPAPASAKDAVPPPAVEAPREEPVLSMPQMEVRKSKIIEINRELQEKDKEIAKAKKNLKSSNLDQSLNNQKVANALSIFGGKGTDVKESLAAQRLMLLEAERDVLEEWTVAKTDKERDALMAELEEYKTMSRNLDQPPK